MALTPWDFLAAGGASLAAGAINALAGGGTLVSFPTLTAIGVPAIAANVTNTVALCPGYLAGTYAQRDDLAGQGGVLRWLAVVAGAGGLGGSLLLDVTPEHAFRALVPYLILMSCGLLLSQDRLRAWLTRAEHQAADMAAPTHRVGLGVSVFAASVYGGFFGPGLGIMLLAFLGLFSAERLVRLNALKQALSFVINVVAALSFALTGHVRWELVPVMAVAALVGGTVGGRFARRVNATVLRRVVVAAGTAVAISFWVG